jgi:hypothetical protein
MLYGSLCVVPHSILIIKAICYGSLVGSCLLNGPWTAVVLARKGDREMDIETVSALLDIR